MYGGNFTQVHTSNLLTLLIFNEYTQVLITRFNRMLFFFTLIYPVLLKFSAVLTFQLQNISLPRIDKNIYFFRLAHFPNIINNLNVLFLNIKRMWFISNIIMHIYPAKKKGNKFSNKLRKARYCRFQGVSALFLGL